MGVAYRIISKKEAKNFIKNLKVIKNRWVFENIDWARKFAKFFKKMNDYFYSGIASALMFRTVGDLISHSLSLGILSKDDLFTSDKEVLKKLKKLRKKDKNLDSLLKRVEGKIKFKIDKKNFNAHCFCKSRIVDPLFETDGKIKRLSEIDKNWAKIVKNESKPKECFIKFE